MNKKGGGKGILFASFFASVFLTIFSASGVFAEGNVGWGSDFNAGTGSCQYEIRNGQPYFLGSGSMDTCFGLSWQYYKWPEDNGVPIYSDILFRCTNGISVFIYAFVF